MANANSTSSAYQKRVVELEAQGMTTSDAQAVIDAQDAGMIKKPTSSAWLVTTHGQDTVVTDHNYGLICTVLEDEDARLIAAAPELLKACGTAAAYFEEASIDDDHALSYLRDMQDAIAKAKSE